MDRVTLNWFQLVAALGAVQGLLLAGVLVRQRHNRTANALLAALMLAFTIYLTSEVYYAAGFIRVWPHFFGVSYQMPWLFGPLVYLYAVAASDRTWRLEARGLLHFLPVIITVLATSPYYLISGTEKIELFDRMVAGDVPTTIRLLDPSKYISGIAYSIATVQLVRRNRRRVEANYSNTRRRNLVWLLRLSGAAAFTWALATTLGVTTLGERLREDHVSLVIALLVYAIGYMGLRQPEVFRYETAEHPVVTAPAVVAAQAASPPPEVAARYERSGLDGGEALRLKETLLAAMDASNPWKDSELTLADLAVRLGTTPHRLSEVLNTHVGMTFYDFVNAYRVRDVQRRIQAGEARTRKMLALAMDAGFASKSTFNQAFKKHTSQTPSDYRNAIESYTKTP